MPSVYYYMGPAVSTATYIVDYCVLCMYLW